MIRYGVINQDNKLVVFDQDEHKQIYHTFWSHKLFSWIFKHPGKYNFNDFDMEVREVDLDLED